MIRFNNTDKVFDTSNPNGAAEINSSLRRNCNVRRVNRCKFHFDNSCIYHLIKIELINLSLLFFWQPLVYVRNRKKESTRKKFHKIYSLASRKSLRSISVFFQFLIFFLLPPSTLLVDLRARLRRRHSSLANNYVHVEVAGSVLKNA